MFYYNFYFSFKLLTVGEKYYRKRYTLFVSLPLLSLIPFIVLKREITNASKILNIAFKILPKFQKFFKFLQYLKMKNIFDF